MKTICFVLLLTLFYCSCQKPVADKHFDLTKTGALIDPPADMPADDPTTGAYYTSLVKMDEIEGFPFDFALYFSTDHSKGLGGIWLYLCNGDITKKENWVSYDSALKSGAFDHIDTKPRKNPIYLDTVQGTQTETHHTNIVNGQVYMSYHTTWESEICKQL